MGCTLSFSTRYHIQSLKLPSSGKREVQSLDFLLCLRMKTSILWGLVVVGNSSLLLLKRNGLSHAEAKKIYQPIPQYHIWINIHKAVPVYCLCPYRAGKSEVSVLGAPYTSMYQDTGLKCRDAGQGNDKI